MKKKISVLVLSGILMAGTTYGSGYRIPEQSINATALSAAYVANTRGADTAYYNPANMNALSSGWHADAELMYIHLPEVDFSGTWQGQSANGSSEKEDFIMPVVHLVSPAFEKLRFGFSLVYPAGLSKEWDETYPRATAKEFTLKTIEMNPTVSYQLSDQLSVGAGVRMIHVTGKVKSNGPIPAAGGAVLGRDMDGDTNEYGYNLALSYKPVPAWNIAATYRSNVDLGVEGDARLSLNGTTYYSGATEVEIPLPAILTLATSYRFDATTIEVTYDKTYWSEYENLDFNYSAPLNTIAYTGTPADSTIQALFYGVFDNSKSKNWSNTDAFRIGITHMCSDKLTTMVGFAIDENPAPDNTLGFELPDSDAKLYSIGFKYQLNEQLALGGSYLYDDKESRSVNQGAAGIVGTFSGGGAHLFNIGANYSF